MSAGKELTFVVFMMHLLAAAWSMAPSEAYALCKCSGAMDKYLVPHYDVLHSMGANALIEDVTGYIRERDMCEVKYNVTIDTYKERDTFEVWKISARAVRDFWTGLTGFTRF